jgi:hypothetical protein
MGRTHWSSSTVPLSSNTRQTTWLFRFGSGTAHQAKGGGVAAQWVSGQDASALSGSGRTHVEAGACAVIAVVNLFDDAVVLLRQGMQDAGPEVLLHDVCVPVPPIPGQDAGRRSPLAGGRGRALWRTPARAATALSRAGRSRWPSSAAHAPRSVGRRGDENPALPHPPCLLGAPHLGQPDAVVGAKQVLDPVEVRPESRASARLGACQLQEGTAAAHRYRLAVVMSCVSFVLASSSPSCTGWRQALTNKASPTAACPASRGAPAVAPTS